MLREGPYAVVIGGANMDICGCSHDNLRIGDSNPGGYKPRLAGGAQHRREPGAARHRYPAADRGGATISNGHHLLEVSQRAGVDVRQVLVGWAGDLLLPQPVRRWQRRMSCAVSDMGIIDELTRPTAPLSGFPRRWRGLGARHQPRHSPHPDWLLERQAEHIIFADTVSVNKVEKIRPWLHRIHTLKPNRTEAEQLCNLHHRRARHLAHGGGLVPPRRGAAAVPEPRRSRHLL